MSLSNILDLPDEILVEIGKHVDPQLLILISKRFLDAYRAHVLKLHLFCRNPTVIINTLGSRAHFVRELHLPYVDCTIWNVLDYCCPNLEYLQPHSFAALREGDIPVALTSLRTLELEDPFDHDWFAAVIPNVSSFICDQNVFPVVPDFLLSLMPQLTSFEIVLFDWEESLYPFIVECLRAGTRLRKLAIRDYNTVSDYRNQSETELALATVIRDLIPQLTHVEVELRTELSWDLKKSPIFHQELKHFASDSLDVSRVLALSLPPSCTIDLVHAESNQLLMLLESEVKFKSLRLSCGAEPGECDRIASSVCEDVYLVYRPPLSRRVSMSDVLLALDRCNLVPVHLLRVEAGYQHPVACDALLQTLSQLSRQPEKLHLLLSPKTSSSPLAITLPSIGELQCNLQSLSEDDMERFTRNLLPAFVSLKVLNAQMLDVPLEAILACAPILTSLKARITDLDQNAHLLEQFTSLRELHLLKPSSQASLRDCRQLFSHLCKLSQLRSLLVSSCIVRSQPLRDLFLALPHLNTLQLSTVRTRECLDVIEMYGQNLRSLSLFLANRYLEQEVRHIAQIAAKFRELCLVSILVYYDPVAVFDFAPYQNVNGLNFYHLWAESLVKENSHLYADQEPSV